MYFILTFDDKCLRHPLCVKLQIWNKGNLSNLNERKLVLRPDYSAQTNVLFQKNSIRGYEKGGKKHLKCAQVFKSRLTPSF